MEYLDNGGSASSATAVYLELRRRYGDGDLAPGERLTESALAQELGVSRTPVREALGRLLADGLVVTTARGVAVAALNRREVEQIYEARASLEGVAAAAVARRQTQGHIAPVTLRSIEQAAHDVERAVHDGAAKQAARANLAFHRAIVRGADNPFLQDMLERVWDRIAVSTVSNLQDADWARSVLDQHQEILQAIAAGDEDAARRASEHHIRAALRVAAVPESTALQE